MPLSTSDDKKNASSIISSGKDLIALLRDLLLFILALMLLFFPKALNKTLVNAGFKEGNIAGFKWEAGIAEYDQNLKESQITINNLKAQLDSTSKGLAEAQNKISDTAFKSKLVNLQKQNNILQTATEKTQTSADKTIAANAKLVQNAQEVINTNDSWVVVISGDANITQAKYETDIAQRLYKIPDPIIYFRQGSYRTVSIFGSRDDAQQVLKKTRAIPRYHDAYLVAMTTWCSNSIQKDGYYECTSN